CTGDIGGACWRGRSVVRTWIVRFRQALLDFRWNGGVMSERCREAAPATGKPAKATLEVDEFRLRHFGGDGHRAIARRAIAVDTATVARQVPGHITDEFHRDGNLQAGDRLQDDWARPGHRVQEGLAARA